MGSLQVDSKKRLMNHGWQDVSLHDAVCLPVHVPLAEGGSRKDNYERLIFENEDLVTAIAGGEKRLMGFAVDVVSEVPEQVAVKQIRAVRDRLMPHERGFDPIRRNNLLSVPFTAVLVKLTVLCKIEGAHL